MSTYYTGEPGPYSYPPTELGAIRPVIHDDYDDDGVIGFDPDEPPEEIGAQEAKLQNIDDEIAGLEEEDDQAETEEAISGVDAFGTAEQIGASLRGLERRREKARQLIGKLQAMLRSIPQHRRGRRQKIRNRLKRVARRLQKIEAKIQQKQSRKQARQDRKSIRKGFPIAAAAGGVAAAGGAAALIAKTRREPRTHTPSEPPGEQEMTHHAPYSRFAAEGLRVPLNFKVKEAGGGISKSLRFDVSAAPSERSFDFKIEGKSYADLRLLGIRVQVKARGAEQLLSASVDLIKIDGFADASYGTVAQLVPSQDGEGFCDLWVDCLRNNDQLKRTGDLLMSGKIEQHRPIEKAPIDVIVIATAYFSRVSDDHAELN